MSFPSTRHPHSGPQQWFSAGAGQRGNGGDFTSQVASEKSGDTFGCRRWAGGLLLQVEGEARDAA